MRKIPLFAIDRSVKQIEDAVLTEWGELLRRGRFIGGKAVETFEEEFANYIGISDCVCVGNGTDALILTLRALGIKPGDEVIVPDFTFIATATAVVLAGGIPVLSDVESSSLNLSPSVLEAHISDKTVGVIVVHLYGNPANMKEINRVAKKYGLFVIEDAAQAHGAALDNIKVGNFSDAATWSFYPTKNLGASGDGGAVTSNDSELISKVRSLANHGRKTHFFHEVIGCNSRLDALEAAFLRKHLKLLDKENSMRRSIAEKYEKVLKNYEKVNLLEKLPSSTHAFHLFTFKIDPLFRDRFKNYMASKGIEVGIYYPLPLHKQRALKEFSQKVYAPNSSEAARSVVSLPVFPYMTIDELDYIVNALEHFFSNEV